MARRRAIRNALARLGMQASPKQVVIALADIGIPVTEGQVRRVKVEILKEAAQAERRRVTTPRIQRPEVCRPKVPPRRGSRS
jgi:hypothetical protein